MTDRASPDEDVLDAPALEVSLTTARQLLEARFGLEATLEPLAGERDRNFRATAADGRRYLLKFTHPAERETVTDFQVRALTRLAERDPTLPIPRVVNALDGDPAPPHRLEDGRISRVRLSTFVAGTPLAGRVPSRTFRRTLGVWLARIDDALADFQHPVADQPMPWDLQRADALMPQTNSLVEAEERELIRQHLSDFRDRLRPRLARLPRQPIHNDLNGHNVLFDPKSLIDGVADWPAGIIDFGDMLFAPRIVDLAVAAAYQMNDPDDPLAGSLALIAGYHRQSALRAEEVELLRGLVETRLAMAITVSTYRASRHPENAAYLLRNTAGSWRALRHCASLPAATFERRLSAALDDATIAGGPHA
ncbi:phosphotransferase [Salinicola peritrichatus]|uniref:phosphotransferase n=1 Tax=Salinicola peritrichatus TaxID=1267424 RepID=UPI000DA1EBE9|nr:phosphotransferase [Salinicola peritrichatus]